MSASESGRNKAFFSWNSGVSTACNIANRGMCLMFFLFALWPRNLCHNSLSPRLPRAHESISVREYFVHYRACFFLLLKIFSACSMWNIYNDIFNKVLVRGRYMYEICMSFFSHMEMAGNKCCFSIYAMLVHGFLEPV